MKGLLKNKDLLVNKPRGKSGIIEYILKNTFEGRDTKLSDVFNFLPSGIIDKTETGIGGTSCELDSKRDSIIVQPYNHTAHSKSLSKSITNQHQIFFYSSYKYQKGGRQNG